MLYMWLRLLVFSPEGGNCGGSRLEQGVCPGLRRGASCDNVEANVVTQTSRHLPGCFLGGVTVEIEVRAVPA